MKLPPLFTPLDRWGRFVSLYVGERKAVALLSLGFYATLFFLIGMSARTELPEWVGVFIGLFLVYGVAFFAVAAEWFWGRWFATGIGYWGLSMTAMAVVTTRSLPLPLVIFGVTHGLVAVCLMGEKMAAAFEAKPDWRKRWNLDEQGVVRLRRSVTRAASSLPALIMFVLAPRETPGGAAALTAASGGVAVALGASALIAVVGLLRRRAWAVLLLGATGVACLVEAARSHAAFAHIFSSDLGQGQSVGYEILVTPSLVLAVAGLFLCAAAVPFVGPLFRFLRQPR